MTTSDSVIITTRVYLVTHSAQTFSTSLLVDVHSKSVAVSPATVPHYSVISTTGSDTSNISNTSSVLNKILIIGVASGGASLICLFCTFMLIVSIAFATKHKKKKQKKQDVVSTGDIVTTEKENKSRSPTPVYEEISLFQFNDIKVNSNKAYGHFYREAEPVYQNIVR